MEEGSREGASDLVCPACRGALERSCSALACAACGKSFPVEEGIADFSERRYFDDHPDPASLSEEARRGYENENAGRRIEDYYLPLLRSPAATYDAPLSWQVSSESSPLAESSTSTSRTEPSRSTSGTVRAPGERGGIHPRKDFFRE
jgi:hypothetical protein